MPLASAAPRIAADPARWRQRSRLAAGAGLIALLALLETVMADRRLPNPASPYVWSLLGAAAAVAFVYAAWCRARAGRAGA